MILVTGGCGYIGSHTCVELLSAGYEVTIMDNLCNSKAEVVGNIARITGKTPTFVEGDIRDAQLLDQLFARNTFRAVMHFAGLKSPGESMSQPARYYENNVQGSLALFQAMERHSVLQLVFSSTAAVYGNASALPIREDSPPQPPNPYGRSKHMVEQMLGDMVSANLAWHVSILRYFNPVGAHKSGLIGERPAGVPNNLMPYIAQVAAGERECLAIFGNDYPTPDGTGVRDYIHVVDLAAGHIKALEHLLKNAGVHIYNLGTGRGYSVMEMLRAFEQASGRNIPFSIQPRRAGDVAASYADPQKAERALGWKAIHGINEMCIDTWRWQQNIAATSV